MRLDIEHVEKIATITADADGAMKLDLAFSRVAFERLSMWERGLLHQALSKAAMARRLSVEQRILLALFAPRGGRDA